MKRWRDVDKCYHGISEIRRTIGWDRLGDVRKANVYLAQKSKY